TEPVASSALQQSKAESTDQSTEPVAAELRPQRDTISLEEWPTPTRLEESIPEPTYQSFDGAISADPGTAAAASSEPELDSPPLDEPAMRTAPTVVEQ